MNISTRQVAFWIDGVGHIVTAPIALLLLDPLAAFLNVPAGRLLIFLSAFMLYGIAVVVLFRTDRNDHVLRPFVGAGNLAFISVVIWSIATHDLSTISLLCHIGTIVSAVGVLASLTRPRRSQSAEPGP